MDAPSHPTRRTYHDQPALPYSDAGYDPKMQPLVYIAALMPDAGELPAALSGRLPSVTTNVMPIGGGFQILDPRTFAQGFADDILTGRTGDMAMSQLPTTERGLSTPITQSACLSKPSWYAVATQGRKITPDLERLMPSSEREASLTASGRATEALLMLRHDGVTPALRLPSGPMAFSTGSRLPTSRLERGGDAGFS